MPVKDTASPQTQREASEYSKALKSYRNLLLKRVNMYGAPSNLARFTKRTAAEAKSEAHELGLKGWLFWLYVMEAKSGKISSDLAQPDESLIEQLSAGVLKAGAGGVGLKGAVAPKFKGEPGNLHTEQTPSGSEQIEKAPGAALDFVGKLLSDQGLRLLEIIAGVLLVLFGLFTLVKGETPSVSMVSRHVV